MRVLKASLVVIGAIAGVAVGFISAQEHKNWAHVAIGAFLGGMLGSVTGWFLPDKSED